MTFKANASVIYTNAEGKQIDTFVIFDTDTTTGLTHINHENLKVASDKLALHSKTVCQYHLPIADAFSYEIIKKLREKYAAIDERSVMQPAKVTVTPMVILAQAS